MNHKRLLKFGLPLTFLLTLTLVRVGDSHQNAPLNALESSDYLTSNADLTFEYNQKDTRDNYGLKLTCETEEDEISLDYLNYLRRSDLTSSFLKMSFDYNQGNFHAFDYLIITLTDAIDRDSKLVYAVIPQPITSGWWYAWTSAFITYTDQLEPYTTVIYQNYAGLKIKGTNQPLVAKNNSFIGPTNSYYRGDYMDVGYNLGKKTALFFPENAGDMMNHLDFSLVNNIAKISGHEVAALTNKNYMAMASEKLVGTQYEELYTVDRANNLFPSGFVTLNIKIKGLHTNQISTHIKSIGGLSLAEQTLGNRTPLFQVKNHTHAVVNYGYRLPKTEITDFREGDLSSKATHTFYDSQNNIVPYTGEVINFPSAGKYRLVTAVKLLDQSIFTYETQITCFSEMPKTNFAVDASLKDAYLTGDIVQIPNVLASNQLSIKDDHSVTPVIVVQNNGVTVDSFKYGSCHYLKLEEPGHYVLAYLFQNAYGKIDNKTYNFQVSPTIAIHPETVPLTLTSGKTTKLSDFTPVDYISNKGSDEIYRAIYLDDQQVFLAKGKTVLSGSLEINQTYTSARAELHYKAGLAPDALNYVKTYEVQTMTPTYAEDYLVLKQDGVLNREAFTVNGTKEQLGLQLNEDSSVTLPQPLSFKTLSFAFDMKAEHQNYDHLEIKLTDTHDAYKELSLKLRKNDDATSKLYLNDVFVANVNGSLINDERFFDWAVDIEHQRLVDAMGNSITGRIKTWSDGTPFKGFKNGTCYLSFHINDVTGTSEFVLKRVNNTPFFSNIIGGNVQKYRDIYSPIIEINGKFKPSYSLGQYVEIPSAKSFDVLSPATTLSLTITDPDDQAIYQGGIEKSLFLLLEKLGTYSVVYTSSDGNDVFAAESKFSLKIKDTTPPMIFIDGEIPSTLALNTTFTFPPATVFDNVQQDCQYYIFVLAPNGRRTMVTNNQYTFDQVGTYEVQYYAFDGDMNYHMINFEIEVR